MKSIKDLREQYNLITEKEEAETKKLTALVRAGLFDAKKLTSLKRALDKPVDKMTAQEKRMLLNLLDALMSEVLSNQPVYQKVKQNVMKEAREMKDYYATPDPRVQRVGYPSQKEAPSVLLLKRKAIRVFPDGQKVALYYAQAIDKYVSIPYNEIGINEEIQIDEGVKDALSKIWSGIKSAANTSSSGTNSSSSSKSEPKYSEPKQSTYKATVVGITPENDEEESPAVASRMRQQYRKQLQIYEYSASDAASDAADILIPGVSAYKNFKKGNYGRAALDAAIDVGSAALSVPTLGGAWAARSALKAGVKGGEKLLARSAEKAITKSGEKAVARTAEKTGEKAVAKSGGKKAASIAGAALGLGLSSILNNKKSASKKPENTSKTLVPFSSKYKPTISNPSYHETDDAIKSTERKLLRKSLQMSESKTIDLNGNRFVLNNKEANKVVSLYESLNTKNKQKMIKMMNESEEQLNKIVSFAVRQ